MNQQIHIQPYLSSATKSETTPSEMELLVQWGFTTEEIASLLWLRQWYQTGGSDRTVIVRYLEFLKFLVHSGEIEL